MTPDQQRIAIAKACGWKKEKASEKAFMGAAPPATSKVWWFVHHLPNYYSDLNAMHEAEKVLDDGVLWHGYLNRLWEVVCPQFEQMSGLNAAVGLLLIHATAAQRAEAFLRTLNLWKD